MRLNCYFWHFYFTQQVNNNLTTQRIGYLDASRGIAASMVMFYHYFGWKYPDNTTVKFSHFIFNGSDAVSFFFVLSGFVLAFPYLQKGKTLDIGKFYTNRIFRIYPAFIVVLLINALYTARHELKLTPLETTFNMLIGNKSHFWEEALLIRGYSAILGLDWTLTVEMVMSFFFPFLIAMVLRNKKIIVWFILSYLLLSNILGYFVLPFALGILACVFFQEIQSISFKETIWYRYRFALLFIAILFFSLRHLERFFPFGESMKYLLHFLQLDFYTFSSIGAFIIMVYIIHSTKAQRILAHPVLLFLGKISYGIYLVHWVIVAAIFDHWTVISSNFPNNTVAFMTMLCVCVLLTISIATLLYYFVELPLIHQGKRLTEKWKSTLEIS